jgi:hypothetical protein
MPTVKNFVENILLDRETTYWNGYISKKLRKIIEGQDVGVNVETTLQKEQNDNIYTLHFRFGESGVLSVTSLIVSRDEKDREDTEKAINMIVKNLVLGVIRVVELPIFASPQTNTERVQEAVEQIQGDNNGSN